MNNLSVSDIFFVITGSAVIILTVMIAIGLLYVISFIRTIRRVARIAQNASELVSEDLSHLRDNIKERGFSLGALATFARSLKRKRTSHKK